MSVSAVVTGAYSPQVSIQLNGTGVIATSAASGSTTSSGTSVSWSGSYYDSFVLTEGQTVGIVSSAAGECNANVFYIEEDA